MIAVPGSAHCILRASVDTCQSLSTEGGHRRHQVPAALTVKVSARPRSWPWPGTDHAVSGVGRSRRVTGSVLTDRPQVDTSAVGVEGARAAHQRPVATWRCMDFQSERGEIHGLEHRNNYINNAFVYGIYGPLLSNRYVILAQFRGREACRRSDRLSISRRSASY